MYLQDWYHSLYTVRLVDLKGLKFRILSLFSIFRKCAVFYFVGACHVHLIIQVWW